jgi:hypothetical protein
MENGTNGASVEIEASEHAETIEARTAREAREAGGRTARALLSGDRVAPLARTAGTHTRDRVREARKLATARLDALSGYPGRKASEADRLAWYLSA